MVKFFLDTISQAKIKCVGSHCGVLTLPKTAFTDGSRRLGHVPFHSRCLCLLPFWWCHHGASYRTGCSNHLYYVHSYLSTCHFCLDAYLTSQMMNLSTQKVGCFRPMMLIGAGITLFEAFNAADFYAQTQTSLLESLIHSPSNFSIRPLFWRMLVPLVAKWSWLRATTQKAELLRLFLVHCLMSQILSSKKLLFQDHQSFSLPAMAKSIVEAAFKVPLP